MITGKCEYYSYTFALTHGTVAQQLISLTSFSAPSKQAQPKFFVNLVAVLIGMLLTGCQSLDYRQMAYSALRHDDCQRNEVTAYCSHSSFKHEYNEYERVRNEFLLSSNGNTRSAEQRLKINPNKTPNSNTIPEPYPLWVTTPENSIKL